MIRFACKVSAPLALFVVMLLVPSGLTRAEDASKQPDAALLKVLQELGYRYQVLPNGVTMIMVPGDNGEIAPVFATPAAQDSLGQGYRIVMVPVANFNGSVPANVTDSLKRLGADLHYGSLQIINTKDGGTIVVFAVKVSVHASTGFMSECLRDVAKVGRQVQLALRKDPTL